MGDNITPPQQAFNWVADVYGSTEEIKARGQVIVGLLHEDIGHLGIFVSGKVAKKEHAQIVSVLKSIETLPPGLYAMAINERKGRDGEDRVRGEFSERRLEDIVARLNRFERADEKPFEAVAAISEFNQRAYELFAAAAGAGDVERVHARSCARQFHPLRLQRWALSDLNPWLAWLGPAAEMVKAQRAADRPTTTPRARSRRSRPTAISASLDYYRAHARCGERGRLLPDLRQRVLALSSPTSDRRTRRRRSAIVEPRELPFVQEALASIAEGGYRRGARARRVPARAQGRAAAPVAACR